jgi:prepilin-type N-terminal cleavage/methylation domain-containing protein
MIAPSYHLPGRRHGMTLIEMLVATTITLIMMGLVAQLFGVFGQGVTGSRSVIELTDQMRSVGWRLR